MLLTQKNGIGNFALIPKQRRSGKSLRALASRKRVLHLFIYLFLQIRAASA